MSASPGYPTRAFLTAQRAGPSTAPVVAEVLHDIAGRLDLLGDVDVSDVTLTPAIHTGDDTSVTVYFDLNSPPA